MPIDYARFGAEQRLLQIDAEREEIFTLYPDLRPAASKLSPSHRKTLSESMKARWAAAHASGKKRLG